MQTPLDRRLALNRRNPVEMEGSDAIAAFDKQWARVRRCRSERYASLACPLMGAQLLRQLLLCFLWPLLWLQARYVRRVTPRMPEPPGPRVGRAGCGSLVRLLVAGDSGAAGVGAPTQEQALCGQLVRLLGQHHTVEWRVMAANGLDSLGLLQLLQEAPCIQFDIVVLSIDANDAQVLCPPLRWADLQGRLAELIEQRFAPGLLVHSAVPPMHTCLALPQPLRWFMGKWAMQMNRSLAGMLINQPKRIMQAHPKSTSQSGMAVDQIHPNTEGYAAWAERLSQCILAADLLCAGASNCSPAPHDGTQKRSN